MKILAMAIVAAAAYYFFYLLSKQEAKVTVSEMKREIEYAKNKEHDSAYWEGYRAGKKIVIADDQLRKDLGFANLLTKDALEEFEDLYQAIEDKDYNKQYEYANNIKRMFKDIKSTLKDYEYKL